MRRVGLGILWRLACVHFTLTWKQKESSFELSSSDWPQMALSLAYTLPACNCCTFGFLNLKGVWFLLVTKAGKVSKLVASFILELFSRALKAFYMSWITTLWASVFGLVGTVDIKLLLVLALHLRTFTSMLLVVIVWILQMTSFSCIFLLVIPCTGASEG